MDVKSMEIRIAVLETNMEWAKGNISNFYMEVSELRSDVHQMRSEMQQGFVGVHNRIDRQVSLLRAEMKDGFARANETFAGIYHTFGEIDRKFGGIDSTLAKIDARFAKSDDTFVKINDRLAKSDDRFAKMDERFAKIDDRFIEIDARFAKIDVRFSELNAKIDSKVDNLRSEMLDRFADVHREFGLLHRAISMQTRWMLGLVVFATTLVPVMFRLMEKVL